MSYVTSQKGLLLDSLENQVLYANICCVIVGEEDIGKSYLIDKLRSRVRSEVFVSEIASEPVLTQAQIEKTICLQLGLSWQENEQSLLEKISENAERRTLLTIDDAHLLSPSCLDFVIGLVKSQVDSGEPCLFVVLAGEVSLAKNLSETPNLKNDPNLCALFELQPFEQWETKPLVAEFQETDVATIEAIYDQQKLDYFWQLSDGNPGRLRYQVQKWVSQDSASPKRKQTKERFKYLSAIGYGVVAVLLILALIYQDSINQLISPEQKGEQIVDSKIEKKQKRADNSQNTSDVNSKSNSDSDSDLQSTDQHSDKLETKLKPKVELQESKNRQILVKEEKEKAGNISEEKDKDKLVATSSQENKVTEIAKVQKKQEEVGKPKSEKLNQDVKKEPKPANSDYSEDERELLRLDDKSYTLQWVGVSELEAAKSYISKHPLASQMKVFKRRSSKSPLYLVVSGNFNSKLDASNARDIYQQRNYPGKPWIKSLAAVKKEIRP